MSAPAEGGARRWLRRPVVLAALVVLPAALLGPRLSRPHVTFAVALARAPCARALRVEVRDGERLERAVELEAKGEPTLRFPEVALTRGPRQVTLLVACADGRWTETPSLTVMVDRDGRVDLSPGAAEACRCAAAQ